MNRFAAGLIAGFIATGPMTLVMRGLHQKLPSHERYPLPPELVTSRMSRRVGLSHNRQAKGWQKKTYLTHFAYGAAAGAVYAAVASRSENDDTLSRGMLFGLVVWTLSYMGLLPAMGLMPVATRVPARRNLIMVVAHLVWGAVTGVLTKRFRVSHLADGVAIAVSVRLKDW